MPQVVFDELRGRLRVRHLDDQSPALLVLELDGDGVGVGVGAVVRVPEDAIRVLAEGPCREASAGSEDEAQSEA